MRKYYLTLLALLTLIKLFSIWPVPGYEKVGGSFGTYQTLEQNPSDSYNFHPAVDIVANLSQRANLLAYKLADCQKFAIWKK